MKDLSTRSEHGIGADAADLYAWGSYLYHERDRLSAKLFRSREYHFKPSQHSKISSLGSEANSKCTASGRSLVSLPSWET